MKKYVALVTGASRGIGLAIRDKLKNEGYEVITPERSEMDLLSNESIDNYLKNLKFPADVLINDAGLNVTDDLMNIKDSDIEEILQVNFISCIKIAQKLVPSMMKNNYGRIVNISSIWSINTKAGRLIYSASKAALSSATRTMAVELAKYNILVNAVAPGFIDTEMTRKNNSESSIKRLIQNVPIGRLGTPEEIAEVAAFLASDKNTFLTGQTIFADGGFTVT